MKLKARTANAVESALQVLKGHSAITGRENKKDSVSNHVPSRLRADPGLRILSSPALVQLGDGLTALLARRTFQTKFLAPLCKGVRVLGRFGGQRQQGENAEGNTPLRIA